MEYIEIFLLLTIISSVLSYTREQSLTECPDESKATDVADTAWLEESPEADTTVIRRLRFPKFGLYDKPIICILATDITTDDTGGDVDITDGGLNHRYVEIRFQSQIGQEMEYLVLIYTQPESNVTQI